MKKAAKDYRYYIIAFALIIIALGIAFLPFVASLNTWFGIDYTGFIWNIDYVSPFCVALFFLVGFVWSDLYKAHWRRKTKNWNGPYPEEIKDGAWARCYSLYLAALVLLTFALVMILVCKIANVESINDLILGKKIVEPTV